MLLSDTDKLFQAESSRFCKPYANHRHLPSFPTRRSSDLSSALGLSWYGEPARRSADSTSNSQYSSPDAAKAWRRARSTDRKSTRLNSSHVKISYAVFCLKNKKKEQKTQKNV